MNYDVAVIGAGIVGLAHALAAVKRGKRVAVFERDAAAIGASIRNFGFVTVTGQAAGDCWQLARRSREVWAEVAEQANIPVLHHGLVVAARRPEAEAVIDAFLATEMADGCRQLSKAEALEYVPALRQAQLRAALYSPHELRVESRTALPQLADWLAHVHGVDFFWSTTVHNVSTPRLDTSAGEFHAEAVVVCPGTEFGALFADRIAAYQPNYCTLQMLRIQPEGTLALGAAVMSDLGLARYHGYADLPAAQALATRLDDEQAEHRRCGVHLIVVQSADGSLVVGDSHHYADTPAPFASSAVDALIEDELTAVLDLGAYTKREFWQGVYAHAPGRWRFTDAPDDATRIVVVTAGCGASTAFGIGEETINSLF